MTRQNSPGRPPDENETAAILQQSPPSVGNPKQPASSAKSILGCQSVQISRKAPLAIDSPSDDKSCQTFNNGLNLLCSIDQAARAVDRAGNDADYQAAFDLFLATVAATIAPDVLRAAMRRQFGPRFGESEVSHG